MTDLTVALRLLTATSLAGLIGYERERHGRAAGLRTHILVALGSCLTVVVSESMQSHLLEFGAIVDTVRLDPTRLGAGVLAGIGFLGAGTIMRHRSSVKGLTTAATLWLVANIGLAVGAGFLFSAIITTAIALACLFLLAPFKHRRRG